MIIGIDLLPLKTGSLGRGIGAYATGLVPALLRLDRTDRYHLYNVPESCRNLFSFEHVVLHEHEATETDLKTLDAFLVLHILELYQKFPYRMETIPCRKFLIFHDLIPLIFWEKVLSAYPEEICRNFFSYLSHVRDFDMVLTNSETTQDDLVRFLGVPRERTRVVSAGLPEQYLLTAASPESALVRIRRKYDIPRPFVLSVLSMDFSKNIPGLFFAWASLPVQVQNGLCLVLVCRLNRDEELSLRREWRGHGLPDGDLILTGFVPDEDLLQLYDAAALFCFATLYEGFGLPVIEAMARGCPVVTADIGAAAETAGDAAVLADPYDPASVAAAICRILEDPGLKERLIRVGKERAYGFRWEAVAERVLAVFREGS